MSLVESTIQDGIAEIRLARPPVNAMNPELCHAVRQAVDDAVGAGAQGIILGSSAKVFSAGLDVPHLVSLGQDREALRGAWQAFFDTALALANAPVPVVAALSGHAPAGGCVWALCCDYRVMASGPFRIGLNETQVGLVVPEGIQRLLRPAQDLARDLAQDSQRQVEAARALEKARLEQEAEAFQRHQTEAPPAGPACSG